MGYVERASRVPGAVVWSRDVPPGAGGRRTPVLPDGCMDLLWTEGRLFVAGPDTRAHHGGGGDVSRVVGVRFAPGTAPAVLGTPARVLRDRRVDLTELWPRPLVRALIGRVDAADDPVRELEAVAGEGWSRSAGTDPLVGRIVAGLRAGRSVAAVADGAGIGARALHRLSLDVFGYGPKTLARVLRFQRALDLARTGAPLAEVAVRCGYADQPHLAREARALTGTPLTGLLA
ncbi:helix-turn-helix domain-containing protein [Streptomyces sp. SID4919]|uniref:helix-turn-helix transcriptional regulator n=1 Tax=unclassified Streptomyces TaxID=2593676 RepID=UPI000823D4E2|nr:MULTISPECIES: helix-turn-helix transcriptional regulator [unclassified Streptomyces]MYY07614.1 helix-turn-helix domain-containing protein [Streptomyces sp. SID4919]SCK52394.1 transcriptional regulator, AraC family [Streptomyces sp. AmelKG-E11A]